MCIYMYICVYVLGNDRTWNFLPNPNRTEPNFCAYDLRSYQIKLIKMRAEAWISQSKSLRGTLFKPRRRQLEFVQ